MMIKMSTDLKTKTELKYPGYKRSVISKQHGAWRIAPLSVHSDMFIMCTWDLPRIHHAQGVTLVSVSY